jgi:hypothetical protein
LLQEPHNCPTRETSGSAPAEFSLRSNPHKR